MTYVGQSVKYARSEYNSMPASVKIMPVRVKGMTAKAIAMPASGIKHVTQGIIMPAISQLCTPKCQGIMPAYALNNVCKRYNDMPALLLNIPANV